jgi:hypothetical protein
MAYEQPGMRYGFLAADIDMSNRATWQFAPVWQGPAVNTVGQGFGGAALVAKGSRTDPPLGILQNNPVQGEAGCVVIGGVSKAIAGGTIAVGAILTPNAGGTALIAATSGTYGMARALESGVTGAIISVELRPFGTQ